jgi:lipopolysaccharide transport system ATP-binding protein
LGAVAVRNVTKKYRHPNRRRPRDDSDRMEASSSLRPREFWALKDVTLNVNAGEVYGIIGPNGAGKSTLLRLIGGVGRPYSGSIKVEGRVGALLELSSDFHPELTGRENALLSGIIAGLTRREMQARMAEIIDFAELRDFIDSPVRVYSSGMLLRLAFAIAVNTDPDVLLIDEVLAVGDSAFQMKCLGRIEELRRQGCAIVFCTHDTHMAAELCNEVMWLRKGIPVQVGRPSEVVAAYMASTDRETRRRTPSESRPEMTAAGVVLRMMENRFGSMEVQISDVRLLDSSGFRVTHLVRGEPLRIEIDYQSELAMPAPNFGVVIRKADDTVIFDGNIPAERIGLESVQGYGSVALTFDRLDLNTGEYNVDVGIYANDWAYAFDYHWRAYPLTVWAASAAKGVVNPPHAWELSEPRRARAR